MTQKKRKRIGDFTKVRGSWFGVNPITRKTPTLIERKRKNDKKHKKKVNYDG